MATARVSPNINRKSNLSELDNDIKEGFICPLCMKDLGTLSQLLQHFDQAHSGEDKQVFNQLRGLFGKAKEKLTKDKYIDKDDIKASSKQLVTFDSLLDPSWFEPQEIGVTRSHTDKFRSHRESKINYMVLETNKLLIRLDKLVCGDMSPDPSKRKVFEKSVVSWVADNDVRNCPSCTKEFNMMRRRHHCRLCGGIMCNKCSYFMSFLMARKYVNPAFAHEFKETESSKKPISNTFLKRSDSSSSLNSLMNTEGEPHIRLCEYCMQLLDKRDQQTEQSQNKPILILLYDKMISIIDELNKLYPKYNTMAESLSAGETTYQLKDGQTLRSKLLSLYEAVDNLSKKMAVLGLKNEQPPGPSQQRLQKRVRQYASDYLQETMFSLRPLPDVEEVRRAREERQARVLRQVKEERERELEAQQAYDKRVVRTASPQKRGGGAADLEGFQPELDCSALGEAGGGDLEPLEQQMQIIRSYIEQARAGWKLDEVTMLEENLKLLQEEYHRQKIECKTKTKPL